VAIIKDSRVAGIMAAEAINRKGVFAGAIIKNINSAVIP